jgi:hypothetical protein
MTELNTCTYIYIIWCVNLFYLNTRTFKSLFIYLYLFFKVTNRALIEQENQLKKI